jgi:hypothetical protein
MVFISINDYGNITSWYGVATVHVERLMQWRKKLPDILACVYEALEWQFESGLE